MVQDKIRISLSQKAYAVRIQENFNVEGCSSTKTSKEACQVKKECQGEAVDSAIFFMFDWKS